MSKDCFAESTFKEKRKTSPALRVFEIGIIAQLRHNQPFSGIIECEMFPEIGANIFDTLLRKYLPFASYDTVHVSTGINGQLSVRCDTKLVKPIHLPMNFAYRMENVINHPQANSDITSDRLSLIPGSLNIYFKTNFITKRLFDHLDIPEMIAQELGNPSRTVSNTFEHRFRDNYGFLELLGDVGLKIDGNVVKITVPRREI